MLSLITEGMRSDGQDFLVTAGLASREISLFLLRICLILMGLASKPAFSLSLSGKPVTTIAISEKPLATVNLSAIPDLQLGLSELPTAIVALGEKPDLSLILEACPL